MALPVGFWTSSGDGCRWMHKLAYGVDGYTPYVNAFHTFPTIMFGVRGCKMFQKPFVTGGTGGNQNINSGMDTGYFALVDSATNFFSGNRINCMMATSVGLGGASNPQPQWKELYGSDNLVITQGDLDPAMSDTKLYRGIYVTPYVDNIGGTRWSFAGTQYDMIAWIPWPNVSTRRWWFWHFQPWAWYGAVPQVIADIVMKCGLPASSIDTGAFDNAYDAFDLTTGDLPFALGWSNPIPGNPAVGLTSAWKIGASRIVGQKCIDLVIECARHSRDFYFTDESGKLSVSSFTRPNSIASLSLDDGVIDVEWRETHEYMFNCAIVSWGNAARVYGNPVTNPDGSDFSVSDEPHIESYTGEKLSGTKENTASIAKYGRIYLKGQNVAVNTGGQPIDVQRCHYGGLFRTHTDSLRLAHVHEFLNSDGQARRFINVTQDMRGLNFSVGMKVSNVAVTDDGETIPDCRCIERTYDFDRLTVTSVLMEVPANT